KAKVVVQQHLKGLMASSNSSNTRTLCEKLALHYNSSATTS
ncbi:37100_t:CDS:1, partial [Racocetra persica]